MLIVREEDSAWRKAQEVRMCEEERTQRAEKDAHLKNDTTNSLSRRQHHSNAHNPLHLSPVARSASKKRRLSATSSPPRAKPTTPRA